MMNPYLGLPGLDGLPGQKGEPGRAAQVGVKGEKGISGNPGTPGNYVKFSYILYLFKYKLCEAFIGKISMCPK